MRTLIHLSDLHFGRIDPATIAPLVAAVHAAKPDLIIVSGDLTQRARTAEFNSAAQFLACLPQPQLVVPGNHDIPMHNLVRRFIDPLQKYRRYICNTLAPLHIDTEIAVAGINTARSLTIKDGRINAAQIARLRAQWATVDPHLIKILVTHHPFDVAGTFNTSQLVGKAQQLLPVLSDLQVDLLLAGHHHVAHAENTLMNYPALPQAALIIQAGTATSTRGRGEANSFNLLRIERGHIAVERHDWVAVQGLFLKASRTQFDHGAQGWIKTGVETHLGCMA